MRRGLARCGHLLVVLDQFEDLAYFGLFRQAAEEAIGRLVNHEDLPLLQEMLKDEDWRIRWPAAKAIGHLVSHEDLPWLQEILHEEE